MNVKSGTLAKAAVAAALSCALASPFVAVNAFATEDASANENDTTVAAAVVASTEEAPETPAAPEAEAEDAAEAPEAEATPAETEATLPPKLLPPRSQYWLLHHLHLAMTSPYNNSLSKNLTATC